MSAFRHLIFGLSGWGKSYYLALLLALERRWVLLSPYVEDFASIGAEVDSFRQIREYVRNQEDFRLRYHVPQSSPEQCYFILAELSRFLMSEGRDCIVAVDEIQRYRPEVRAELPREFYLLLDEGRHRNLVTYAVARRPMQTTPLLRSLADHVVTFRLNSANDIKVLEDYFGDAAEDARSLPKFWRMEWTAEDSRVRYFDASGTERSREEVLRQEGDA